ncbi:MAG TPA: sulfotransferase [Nevskiaceae bacterium]|nr:sulfotransferase [Nevskiaceae bacterium]
MSAPTAPATLRYCFICSTGRAGSTLTARVLSSHPAVLARALHPYETRMRQYLQVARRGEAAVHFRPLRDGEGPEYVPHQGLDEASAAWCQATQGSRESAAVLAERYYREVARVQGVSAPQWVIEKGIGIRLALEILGEDPQARALFLFRDPRDTFFSMKAFNRKAGYEGGFQEDQGEEVMFRNVIGTWRRYKRLVEEFGPGRITRLRYEAIVQSATPWTEAFRWLAVADDAATVGQAFSTGTRRDAAVELHSTTQSVDASIGRWAQEASEAQRALFDRYAADLVDMGYAP